MRLASSQLFDINSESYGTSTASDLFVRWALYMLGVIEFEFICLTNEFIDVWVNLMDLNIAIVKFEVNYFFANNKSCSYIVFKIF